MIRGEDVRHDLDRVLALGASEDAEDDVVELLGRAQQQAPLDGAAGHLDEGPAGVGARSRCQPFLKLLVHRSRRGPSPWS